MTIRSTEQDEVLARPLTRKDFIEGLENIAHRIRRYPTGDNEAITRIIGHELQHAVEGLVHDWVYQAREENDNGE